MNYLNHPYRTQTIEKRLVDLDNKINILDQKIDKILLLLESEIKPDCNKMSSHIDFVDKVYETVKSPLEYVCKSLQSLKDKNDTYQENINLIKD